MTLKLIEESRDVLEINEKKFAPWSLSTGTGKRIISRQGAHPSNLNPPSNV
jgi:hypothetical protein